MIRRPAPVAQGGASRALRWGLAGAILGLLLAGIAFAPARWLAAALADASGERVLLAEARGTIWRGSGVLVLTGGPDSRDASVLPGRMAWRIGPRWRAGPALLLQAEQACCINGSLDLLARVGWNRIAVELLPGQDWLAQWPSAWLSGLGTPFNTLQLGGRMRLQSQGLSAESTRGRWRLSGTAEVDLIDLSSALSTLPVLGSYRLSLSGDPGGASLARLRLSTREGALQVDAQGEWGHAGLRLRGEARAATPSDEKVLGNLLNLVGRRQGARSVFSIG